MIVRQVEKAKKLQEDVKNNPKSYNNKLMEAAEKLKKAIDNLTVDKTEQKSIKHCWN